jgi:hypothetical protein
MYGTYKIDIIGPTPGFVAILQHFVDKIKYMASLVFVTTVVHLILGILGRYYSRMLASGMLASEDASIPFRICGTLASLV